jgi:hypothetical protein
LFKKLNLLSIIIFTLMFQGACATVDSVAEAKESNGSSFTLEKPCVDVKDVLIPAIVSLDFKIKLLEDYGECDRKLVAANELSAFSWGELINVRLQPIDHSTTRMTVTTKRRLVSNITAKGDWSKDVLVAVMQKLNAAKDARKDP